RGPADRRLGLGELRRRVDALEVEVVGRDVRQDARVVRFVSDPPQDDPAARSLEDRDVDVAPAEDLSRAPGAGPVARIDHALVDADAVRRRRAALPAGEAEE